MGAIRQFGQIKKSIGNSLFTYTLVVAAFVVVQALWMSPDMGATPEEQLIPIRAHIVMTLALNLIVGVSGELSLGRAGFMGIGAFVGSALAPALQSTTTPSPLHLALAMVLSAVIAAAPGFLIGIPVLRLNDDCLAIVTLALGEVIKSIVTNVYLSTDENGLRFSFFSNKSRPADGGVELIHGLMGVMSTQRIPIFIAGFVLVLVILVIILNLVNSRTGRAVMTARDSRIIAESVGISVTKCKMIAFMISVALTSAVDTPYGCSQTIFTATKFDFNTPILILVSVTLDGLDSVWGSVIAATALTILPETLRQLSNYRILVYVIVLILAMLAANNPALKGLSSRLFHRERADAPRTAAVKGDGKQ